MPKVRTTDGNAWLTDLQTSYRVLTKFLELLIVPREQI